MRIQLISFQSSIDIQFDVIRWNFSNLSNCFRLWLCLFMSTCTLVYYSFHFWAYKRLSFLPNHSLLSNETDKLKQKKPTSLSRENIFDLKINYLPLFQLYSIGFGLVHIVVILDCFYTFPFITFSRKIIQSLRE